MWGNDLTERKRYNDIKVVEGGWDMDAGQQPKECSDLYSIAQDIKHAILESGLLANWLQKETQRYALM